MKKTCYRLMPVLLLAAVFTAALLLKRYTYYQAEFFNLFLNTPDYLQEVLGGPHPYRTLVREFTLQFFRLPGAGPAIVALLVTLGFLLARLLYRLVASRRLSCGASAILAALALAGFVTAALLPESRQRERWAKVERASLKHQWDKVIAAATPKACEKDRTLIPYALLAHSQRGTLPQALIEYPVSGPQDLDMEGELTRHGYYFSSLLYEDMGCTNEAIHHTFQTACTTPHGASFGTLRQLIKLNIAAGNKPMARKYCDILATSPVNAGTARAARRIIDAMPAESYLDHGASDTAAIVSHNAFQNLRLMATHGYFNDAAVDRTRCLLLLQRDLNNFAGSFPPDQDLSALPLVYQQAFCLVADPRIQERLSPAIKAEADQFMTFYNRVRMKDEVLGLPRSYWAYYFLGY